MSSRRITMVLCLTLGLGWLLFAQDPVPVVPPVPAPDPTPIDWGRPCSGDELNEKSCTEPGKCTNACAYHCSDKTQCRQCCLHFETDDRAYQACRQSCEDVWPT